VGLVDGPDKKPVVANVISLGCADLLAERADGAEQPLEAVARVGLPAAPRVCGQLVSFPDFDPPESSVE